MATWSHNSREPLSNSLILESLCQILRNSALRSLRKPHRAPWLHPLPLPKKRHSKDTQLLACHHNLIVFLSLVRTATGLRGSWLYLRLVASYVALSIRWIVTSSRLIVKDGNVPRRVPSLCGDRHADNICVRFFLNSDRNTCNRTSLHAVLACPASLWQR